MADSNFIDYVKICCRSGKGGAGSRHFFRDKMNARGGPDGGDGGRGGHIVVKGNKQLWTLLHLKYRKHVIAEPGDIGRGGNKFGAEGKDVILEVPLGTIVKDAETGELVAEVEDDGQEVIILSGGKGGLGNTHFKSATRQAPTYAQPGLPGQEQWMIFELKVLADVGLVGFPNAGKSSLVRALSAATPEVADYPFTTLVPHLGVVDVGSYKSFVIADIPGIIEGASEGKGLGHRFLKHIERNAVLLYVISAEHLAVKERLELLKKEMALYDEELLNKPYLITISKADLLDDELKEELKQQLPDIPFIYTSTATEEGLKELKFALWSLISDLNED